jgi:hypothetical protein
MSERFPTFEDNTEDSFGPGERLEVYHAELRRRVKDFRTVVERSPAELPNREKLIQISREILDLVPIVNQREEDEDEAERKLLLEQARESARTRNEERE